MYIDNKVYILNVFIEKNIENYIIIFYKSLFSTKKNTFVYIQQS